jgi:hypothetical protein
VRAEIGERGGPVGDLAIVVARLEGDDAPGDVIDALEGNPSLEVSGARAVGLHRCAGIRVDLEARSERTEVSLDGASLYAVPGRKLRLYALDVDGRTVVLVVDPAGQASASDS